MNNLQEKTKYNYSHSAEEFNLAVKHLGIAISHLFIAAKHLLFGIVLGFILIVLSPSRGLATNGIMTYHDSTATGDVKYRTFDGSAFAAESSSTSVANDGWHSVKACPTRDEKILVVQNAAGGISAMVWNGSVWTNKILLSSYASYDGYKRFGVAYEQTSGDAIVVYSTGTLTSAYRIWNGTSWAAQQTGPTVSGGSNIYWVEMASQPGSDEIMLGIQATANVDGWIWDGSAFGNAQAMETATQGTAAQSFDVVYMNGTGNRGMFVWGDGGVDTPQYRIWYSTPATPYWSSELLAVDQGATDILWVKLAADPNSDSILLGTSDDAAAPDADVQVWDGSAWGNYLNLTGDINVADGNRQFDVAYEATSGDGLVVWSNLATKISRYRTWSSGAWGAEDGTVAVAVSSYTYWQRLVSDPNSNQIVLLTSDIDNDLYTQVWDGSAWGSVTEEAVSLDAATDRECFSFAYDEYVAGASDTTAPCAVSNLTALAKGSDLGGRVTLKWSAPGDDGTMVDNSAGAYEIKYATKYIGAADYAASWTNTYTQSWTPTATWGSEELKILNGSNFKEGTTYFFTIKTKDSDNNWSVWPGTTTSINSLSWSLPTSSAPASITTLSALTGDSGGEIDLTWPAPGDDGTTGAITDGKFAIRYATYTNVDWTSASSEWTDFDDQYELVIDTDTNNYNEVHSRTMTSLHEGVTYYLRLKTADEKPNWSALSNNATAYAYTTPPATPPEMIVIYSSSTNNSPLFRTIADGTTYWGSEGSLATAAAEIEHIVVKEDPTGDFAITAALNNSGEIYMSTYTSLSGWAGSFSSIADQIGVTNDAFRGFDIAFEDQTGDGYVFYQDNVADTIYYRRWNGSSFDAESSTTNLATGGIPLWIKAVRRPGYDTLALIYLTDTGEVGALIYDGSAWTAQKQLGTGVPDTGVECIDVVNMGQSRDFMFAWATGTVVNVMRWDGSFGSIVTLPGSADIQGVVEFIAMDSNSEDKIMLVALDDGDAVNTIRYDGSSWDAAFENHDVTGNTYDNKFIDVSWEASGSDCVFVWGDTADTNAKLWDGSAWSADNFTIWADANACQLERMPNEDIWLLAYDNGVDDLQVRCWKPDSNTWVSSSTIETTPLSLTSDFRPVYITPAATSGEPLDETPPAAISNLTALSEGTGLGGQIKLKWTAPGDDGASGTADSYVVKYGTNRIDSADWDAVWVSTYTQSWTPAAAGSDEGPKQLTGFSEGTTYWFAMKAYDGVNYGVWNSSKDVSTVNNNNWNVPTD
nr:hypothetical protein [Elusimicrobiota bacterium]